MGGKIIETNNNFHTFHISLLLSLILSRSFSLLLPHSICSFPNSSLLGILLEFLQIVQPKIWGLDSLLAEQLVKYLIMIATFSNRGYKSWNILESIWWWDLLMLAQNLWIKSDFRALLGRAWLHMYCVLPLKNNQWLKMLFGTTKG